MNETDALYNLEQLKQSIHHDGEFLVLMLNTFIQTNSESLANMGLALEKKQWKSVGEIAHKMLSSYRHLSINSLLPALARLEKLIWEEIPQTDIVDNYGLIKRLSEIIFKMLNEEIDIIKKA